MGGGEWRNGFGEISPKTAQKMFQEYFSDPQNSKFLQTNFASWPVNILTSEILFLKIAN